VGGGSEAWGNLPPPPRNGRWRVAFIACAVAAVGALLWSVVVAVSARSEPRATPTRSVVPLTTPAVRGVSPFGPTVPPPVSSSSDSELLGRLVRAPETDPGGYDRDSFGYPQGGTDSRGCNTRSRVLIRDSLVPAHVDDPGCKVTAGRWLDAYDGRTYASPSDVSVDHVVALKEAWRSGAATWDVPRRVAFGNDLEAGALVLIAGPGNSAKGDKDPAAWAPADPVLAKAFAHAWLTTKVRWGLAADPAEAAALERLLSVGPPPAPTTPQGLLTPAPTTGEPYYATCAAARAAGAAPLRRGSPGYREALDRDRDGVACE
jgi:hypothetical protein